MIKAPHGGETRGHRHRIGRESPALGDRRLLLVCVEHRHHSSAARDRADRESSADDLSQRIEIGLEPVAGGCTVEALAEVQHFVADDQDLLFAGDVLQGADERRVRCDQTRAARHRVEHDRGQ